MKFGSVDEILDYAIRKEQEAADLYMSLAGKVEKKHMKVIFEEFALEEKGHKLKLEKIKEGKLDFSPLSQKITDLKIGDYLVDTSPDADLTYQQALIIAMKEEKAAFRLYNDLAALTDNPEFKQIFLGLAQEEAKHKLRFEIEYDDMILTEN